QNDNASQDADAVPHGRFLFHGISILSVCCMRKAAPCGTGDPVHMVRLWVGGQKRYCLCRIWFSFTSFLPVGKNIYIKSASRVPAPRGAKLLLALVCKNNSV